MFGEARRETSKAIVSTYGDETTEQRQRGQHVRCPRYLCSREERSDEAGAGGGDDGEHGERQRGQRVARAVAGANVGGRATAAGDAARVEVLRGGGAVAGAVVVAVVDARRGVGPARPLDRATAELDTHARLEERGSGDRAGAVVACSVGDRAREQGARRRCERRRARRGGAGAAGAGACDRVARRSSGHLVDGDRVRCACAGGGRRPLVHGSVGGEHHRRRRRPEQHTRQENARHSEELTGK